MNRKNLKFIFWGTEKFARDILKILIDNDYIPLLVITPPDKKVGRKQILTASPVKLLALENNIEIAQPEKIKKNKAFYKKITDSEAELSIVAQYGKILPLDILNIPFYKSINVHGSILPKYRGAAPVQFALLNGEKNTGVTLIQMDEKMDHGPILATQELKIESNDTTVTLLDKLAILGGYLLTKTLPAYLDDDVELEKQIHEEATFTKMIKKEDGLIDWDENAEKIYNKFQAYFPWPGIYTFLEGKRLKILNTEFIEKEHQYKAGEIIFENKNLYIAAKKDLLKINELQLEGKKAMSAESFIQGYKRYQGEILK